MEILTGQQMRNVDRRAIEQFGIPGLDLMEAAGRGVAEAFLEDHADAADRGVLIVCGKGSNGGDGLVVARHLSRSGLSPRVILLAAPGQLSGDAAANLESANRAGVRVESVTDIAAWDGLDGLLDEAPYVIDAILGTGIRGGARGLPAAVIRQLNESGARVVSVDLPSGVDSDSPAVAGEALRAERTYTLCRPKLPLVLPPSDRLAGRWRVIPIGIPDEAVSEERGRLEWLDAEVAASLLPARPDDAHKGALGHLLAVAGAEGKTGAAILLARGALRSGVGLLTVATRASCRELVAAGQAEMMTESLEETAAGELGPGAAPHVLRLLAQRDALAIGPGLGTDAETQGTIARLIADRRRPTVVDADALAAIARSDPAAGSAPALVLTPHPGEASRLLGCATAEVQADRLGAAARLVERTGATVVLKGHRSVIASPDGRTAINSSGNPGMATAGTGDVLTGIVGALLARGLAGFDAARLAVYLHGDAGDRAAAELGPDGMIASDLVDRLPAAFAGLVRGEG